MLQQQQQSEGELQRYCFGILHKINEQPQVEDHLKLKTIEHMIYVCYDDEQAQEEQGKQKGSFELRLRREMHLFDLTLKLEFTRTTSRSIDVSLDMIKRCCCFLMSGFLNINLCLFEFSNCLF